MQQYHNALRTILNNGRYKGDRTGTGTFSYFGMQMRFNLADGFPLVTTKKVHLKSIIHELLWFLSGKTDISYLKENGVTIWDEWATSEQCARFKREAGDLGPVYGHQWRNFGATKNPDGSYNPDGVDQISEVINTIKTNPNSRRIIVTGWNPREAGEVALPPCHTLFQFFVDELTSDELLDSLKPHLTTFQLSVVDYNGDGEENRRKSIAKKCTELGIPTRRLSCQLYARSQDIFLGTPFNIASYALLLMMVAQVTNTVPHEFIWTGGDCHIYTNHMLQVQTQLARECKPLPVMKLNPDVKNIFDFKYEDFTLTNYDPHPAIKAPVAV